jgi:hypothetical protein
MELQRGIGNQAVSRVLQRQANGARTGGTKFVVQRQCACGAGSASLEGECEECAKKKMQLQTKLRIGGSGDVYELEADRVATQVMSTSSLSPVGNAPAHIQRLVGPSNAQLDEAPASVERVLTGTGMPLESGLLQNMELRFGHDFSKVRIHDGAEADRSASDVNSIAYTVGHDIVFGSNRFKPNTSEGRRLLAHELTHVVQQTQPPLAGHAVNRQVQRDEIQMPSSIGRSGKSITFAQRVGHEDAEEIRKKGYLSVQDRAAFNQRLAEFTGAAKEAYLREVKPALLAATAKQTAPQLLSDAAVTFGAYSDLPPVPGQSFHPIPNFSAAPGFPSGSKSTLSSSQWDAFGTPKDGELYWWEYKGEKRVPPCPDCHQPNEQRLFQTNREPTGWVSVKKGELLQWARDEVWQWYREDREILSLLQRKKDDQVTALWNSHRDALISTVRLGYDKSNKRVFEGTSAAKERWADVLRTEWDRTTVVWLNEMAEDWLIREIAEAKRLTGPYARLVTDPTLYAQIEDDPWQEQINIGGPYNDHVGVGFVWLGRQAVSVSSHTMEFQVMKHPRIYFEMGTYELDKAGTFAAAVFGEVAKAAEGLAVVGAFVKGVFNSGAGIGESVIDAGAKLIDMGTQFVAAVGKGTGWYHIGYSCLSSTCKQYQAGVKQSTLIKNAFADASVIVPLYQQGKQCLVESDPEACGGVAGAAVMAVFAKMSERTAPIEEAMIRDEINRPAGSKALAAAEEDLTRGRKAAAAEGKIGKAEKETKTAEHPETREIKGPVLTVEEARTKEMVRSAAEHARSEIVMSGERHGVAAYGRGDFGGFQLCSHCGLLAEKLAELEKILPPDSELAQNVRFLKEKATGYDREYRRGHLKDTVVEQAARDLSAELRNSVIKHWFVEQLLDMSVEDLRSNRAALKKQAAASPALNDTPETRAARADATAMEKEDAARNAGRIKADPLSDAEVERAFRDDLTSSTPGKTSHSTAPSSRPLSQDVSLNIDEVKAVGESNSPGKSISDEERRWRALSLDNREFKDAPTNQKTKRAAPDPRDAARPKKPTVSLRDDPNALWTHRFGEISEIATIGERIKAGMEGKNTRAPGQLKAELNSKLWDEFKTPKSAEGRAVAEALESAGFGFVDVNGVSVLRQLLAKELRARGLRYVDGHGWVRPLGSGR